MKRNERPGRKTVHARHEHEVAAVRVLSDETQRTSWENRYGWIPQEHEVPTSSEYALRIDSHAELIRRVTRFQTLPTSKF